MNTIRAVDERIQAARSALLGALDASAVAERTLTIREATQIGNRLLFALRVLDSETSLDKHSVTVSYPADPPRKEQPASE